MSEVSPRATKAFRRSRGVRSTTGLLRLALVWAPGGYSMQRVAVWAGERNIATLTEGALIQRLRAMGSFLEELTRQLLTRVGERPCWHGRVPRVSDGTSLSGPASKGTDWRVHGVHGFGLGGFTRLEVTDSHGGEAPDRGKPVAGEIRVADRGHANALAWQRFLQTRDERTDFIVRMRRNTVRLVDAAGKDFCLIDWPRTSPGESETHEITACTQSGKHQPPIGIYLITGEGG